MILRTTSINNSDDNIVTIHQPAFFPWYPFFEKLRSANTFVFLTRCQYEKNGYQNRFNIGSNWYTMSVKKGLIPICEKKYANPQYDWSKIKKSLRGEYGEILDEFDECISENLCQTNIAIIEKICKLLKIRTSLHLDIETTNNGTERLVEICSHYKASQYIAGSSGLNYLDVDQFKSCDIEVSYQNLDNVKKIPVLQAIKEML